MSLFPLKKNLNSRVMLLIVGAAVLSGFLLRIFFIDRTPENDRYIDLNIYQSSGFLMAHGINPYDFSAGQEIREQLRAMQSRYNPWVCETQERWNYYASSNLPLSQFFYQALATLGGPNPYVWRLLLAVFDSILGGIAAWYVLRFWPYRTVPLTALSAFVLGACSPLLISYGTVIPEDKGPQILLMLLALATSRAERTSVRLGLSPLILGCSIAFKLLGIFIVPLCLFWAIQPELKAKSLFARASLVQIAVFFSLTLFGALIWCVPFGLRPLEMIVNRIHSDVGSLPLHASLWRYWSTLCPDSWPMIRAACLLFAAAFVAYGLWRRRLGIPAATAIAFVVFATAVSLHGSMDRIHIALAIALFILGEAWGGLSLPLMGCYLVGGLLILFRAFAPWSGFLNGITFPDAEYLDSLVCMAFVTLLLGLTIVRLLKPDDNASSSSYNRSC